MTHQGDVGGSTNSITWLTRGLAERGHEVFLACRPESLIASRFEESDVQLVAARLPRGFALWSEAKRWRSWMAEHEIQVVNAHASLDRHLVSYVRMLGTKARVVHTRRNVALSFGGWPRAWFDRNTTDGIVTVSRRIADEMVRQGQRASHLQVIHNGLPLDELREPDASKREALLQELQLREGVPVLGIIARRKSQEDLLRAAVQMNRPLEILMAGTDEDDALREAIRELPDGVRARCLGFRDDVPEISELLDVFVLPSTIEGFSLALLEAMARGLACVATDAGGNAEALEDGAGLLVPPNDPGALAHAVSRVLDDPGLADSLRRRARERAHGEFDVRRTVEKTEAFYENLRSEGL